MLTQSLTWLIRLVAREAGHEVGLARILDRQLVPVDLVFAFTRVQNRGLVRVLFHDDGAVNFPLGGHLSGYFPVEIGG